MPRMTKRDEACLSQAKQTFRETMEMVREALSNATVALALKKPRSVPREERLELTNDQLDLVTLIIESLTISGYGWWTDDYTAEDFVKSVGLIPEYLDA
jgi:hypothetical protein